MCWTRVKCTPRQKQPGVTAFTLINVSFLFLQQKVVLKDTLRISSTTSSIFGNIEYKATKV